MSSDHAVCVGCKRTMFVPTTAGRFGVRTFGKPTGVAVMRRNEEEGRVPVCDSCLNVLPLDALASAIGVALA